MFVMCEVCAIRFFDENGYPNEVFLAQFGPQDLEDGKESVLISMRVDVVPPMARMMLEGGTCPCDGCGAELSISESSKWFMERRALRPPTRLH